MLDRFDRWFSVRLPVGRFARNTVLLSLGALLPVLAAYVTLTPGFWAHLEASGAARRYLLRQLLTNGLPVVMAVNWAGFVLYARLRGGALRPATALGLDLAARIGLFAVLHGAIFAGSALVFGSFGGDPAQALVALGPTLAQAAGFGNLAGVYLYATLASALPLHVALIGRTLGWGGALLILPALGLFAVQVLALTALARLF